MKVRRFWVLRSGGAGPLPRGRAVLYALAERVAPFYHLLENADELAAQPMLCLDVHWHQYDGIAKLFEGRLEERGLLDPATVTTIRSLQDTRLAWLERVPIPSLAKLREDNANATFRTKLDQWTHSLRSSSVADLNRTVAEVTHGLQALLREHKTEIKRIRADFKTKHKQTLATSAVGLAAVFLPALAPFLGSAAPVGLAAKYAWDKMGERAALEKASRSLTGVLAKARGNPPSRESTA